MSVRLWTYAGMAGFFAIAVAYDQYDKSSNYTPVQATIQRFSQSCYLEDSKYTTDTIDCARAEKLKASHPKYKSYTLKRTVIVTVSFKSPVDNDYHVSDLKLNWREGNKLPATGESMQILASKTKPDGVRNL
jgi:hypothetical protein